MEQRERQPIPQPERPASPEVLASPETSEPQDRTPAEPSPELVQEAQAHVGAGARAPKAEKSTELIAIESILSDGLTDLYRTLPPAVQPAFKAKGEEVAMTIQTWMQEAKLKAKRVLKLLREWLSMAPNINKHYLEQASKIKKDQVMELATTRSTDILE